MGTRRRRRPRTSELALAPDAGPEFSTLAFKFAHEADPDAKLYYNDYSIEVGPKHASSMVLLQAPDQGRRADPRCRDPGPLEHGDVPYAAVDQAIADYASLGLKVSITELDVTIRGASGGQLGPGGFGGPRAAPGPPPARLGPGGRGPPGAGQPARATGAGQPGAGQPGGPAPALCPPAVSAAAVDLAAGRSLPLPHRISRPRRTLTHDSSRSSRSTRTRSSG
jgi:hypothetical protein